MTQGSHHILEDAIALASRMHYGQRDKTGSPYILHPLRVMLRGQSGEEMVLGVLHDVVEDCPVTLDEVELKFGRRMRVSMDAITHRPNEPNMDYIRRVMQDPLAHRVKIWDIEDNSAAWRMDGLDIVTQNRLQKKYTYALGVLRECQRAFDSRREEVDRL